MPGDRSVTIELDVFSGRPNPSWEPGPPEQAKLLQLLRSNDVVAGRPEAPPGLGYRGFIVKIGSNAEEDVLRVGGGAIERQGKYYRDEGRAVEKYLIQIMPDGLRSQFRTILPQ